MANRAGLGMIGAQQQASQLPGAWETTVGRVGQIGGALTGLRGLPGFR